MIPITSSLCNNIMSKTSLDIKDAHSRKDKRKRKQSPHRYNQRLAAARAPPVVTIPVSAPKRRLKEENSIQTPSSSGLTSMARS
jgi:hypothetical protein